MFNKRKNAFKSLDLKAFFLFSVPARTRTVDLLIKSQ